MWNYGHTENVILLLRYSHTNNVPSHTTFVTYTMSCLLYRMTVILHCVVLYCTSALPGKLTVAWTGALVATAA